jgi:hypothetical protein
MAAMLKAAGGNMVSWPLPCLGPSATEVTRLGQSVIVAELHTQVVSPSNHWQLIQCCVHVHIISALSNLLLCTSAGAGQVLPGPAVGPVRGHGRADGKGHPGPQPQDQRVEHRRPGCALPPVDQTHYMCNLVHALGMSGSINTNLLANECCCRCYRGDALCPGDCS